ncbi:ABC transporter ATP-binding protein [Alsobacter sp. KACC 23698]|uniref:ABC transporter ATP-binding protein n=1 Tax=Alsobacter sp. KACC 23698 TaxID=3149229 RepID=A0AAU7JJ00_9HYPH
MSFSTPLGSLSGVIGPNGAGKSTLFALISGFQASDLGEVTFAGQRLDGLSADQRARQGLARTFQVPRPFAHLTVRENLAVGAQGQAGEGLFNALFRGGLVRRQERRIFERVDGVIDFLKLGAVATAPAGRLSGGQRKLLELGRALMMEPKFILLDEPFAGVNPVLIDEISDRIKAANARGVGFLIVEHNLSSLARLVDRMLVMDRGRLLADGAPDEVLDDKSVQEAYMGGVVA